MCPNNSYTDSNQKSTFSCSFISIRVTMLPLSSLFLVSLCSTISDYRYQILFWEMSGVSIISQYERRLCLRNGMYEWILGKFWDILGFTYFVSHNCLQKYQISIGYINCHDTSLPAQSIFHPVSVWFDVLTTKLSQIRQHSFTTKIKISKILEWIMNQSKRYKFLLLPHQ